MVKQLQMMVSVIVRAYNQEVMVKQTLDSILAQQTTYSFEIIIGENHSSDNTLAVCRAYEAKYGNIRILAHEQNIGPQRNLLSCIKAGIGKYIMVCDGDDWWHNPNKIQLQVDFMESHPECVVLHSDYDTYDERTRKTIHGHNKSKGINILEGQIQREIFSGNPSICWPTSCIRRSAFEQYMPLEKFIEVGTVGEDWPTWVILSAYGEVRYLPVSTVTYRMGNISVTRDIDYNRILRRREGDKNTVRLLHEMFPYFGAYHEDEYFNNQYSHLLLLAAYRNNDYASAKKFAREDKRPTIMTRMAYTWITFQIARLLRRP